MFLMNPPPVVALQTKWTSFGPSRSYRFPVNFSESEEDIAGTPINAKVQMIISNLHTDESSLDMNNEYDCIMQKNRNGDKCFDGLPVDARLVKVQSQECVKVGLPVELSSTEEDSTEFGPLVLDSDSDDSVDRDIEEAIQEYLKNKSETGNSNPSDAECSRFTQDVKPSTRNIPQSSAFHDLMAAKAKMDSKSYNEGSLDICKKLQCSSPATDDSEDSFEESIRAEIEQFLIEKKQVETTKTQSTLDKKTEIHIKVKSDKRMKVPEKNNFTNLKQNCEELVIGRHKKHKARPPSKFPTSTVVAASKRHAALIKTPPLLEQQNVCFAAPKQTFNDRMDESGGSSSDDGIEEAIQLFQMEKQKKEGKPVPHSHLLKDPFKVSNCEESFHHGSTNPFPAESPKKVSKKRKRTNLKLEQKLSSNAQSQNVQALKYSRVSAPPVDKIAKFEPSLMSSFRAESAAELMCAEAILDISKTIMPLPMGEPEKSLEFNSNTPTIPHHSDSDSSAVDSDDSIEQEIRSFLALKAQTECSLKPEISKIEHQNVLSGQQRIPISSCTFSSPKTKLSLSHKRKKKTGSKGVQLSVEQQNINIATESSQMTDQRELENRLCPSICCIDNFTKADNDMVVKCTLQDISECKDSLGPVAASTCIKNTCTAFDGGGPERRTFRLREPSFTGDKSSSLDSDEDLDAAIKDLLRSKRKCKKKVKDQKPHCKKKVRFGDTEMQGLEACDALKQKDCSLKCPSTLKSCLLKPREVPQSVVNVSEDTLNTKQENIKSGNDSSFLPSPQKEGTESVCTTEAISEFATEECIVEVDENSSVDSDDGIEQEIQKFLAEKAKESVSPVYSGDALASSNSPEKANDLSQHSERSTEKSKKPDPIPTVLPHQWNASKASEPYTDHTYCPTVKPSTPPRNARTVNEVTKLCGGKGVLLNKKNAIDSNLGRLADNNVRATLLSSDLAGKTIFPVTILGNFVAGLQYIPGNVRTVFVNGKHVYSVVPSTRESDAQALRSKMALGLAGQSAKTTPITKVQVSKDLIKQPVNSKEPVTSTIFKSELKEQSFGVLPIVESRTKEKCEGVSLLPNLARSSVVESPLRLNLNVPKEPQPILSTAGTLVLCTEKVTITNETKVAEGSSQERLNTSYPVLLKPESEVACTYVKYDRRVDQRQEESVDKDSCKFNVCVQESKSSGETGKGSNL
ncbi:protein phosphatase 1 regulatory subunit 26 [Ambystoma mexicanum]|uniref:protein phosphatase 1 regulatory subunit 26 n=1 Tax=Ambystoma mexicanum TaxID=8296 RepID=UPI0037E7E55A